MTKPQRQCQGKVHAFAGYCERPPTVERDGKLYCWQHDPVRLKELANKRWAIRKAEIAAMEAKADARIARRRLEIAAGMGHVDDVMLRRIAALGGLVVVLDLAESTRNLGAKPDK